MSTRTVMGHLMPAVFLPYWQRLQASPISYRLAKGAFWSLAGAVISRGLGLLASILVARMLGKVGFGELGIIQSTIGMFGVFAGFGLGVTATKYVAEFRAKDPGKAGRIIALSGVVAIGSGAIMSVALFVFAPWLAEHTLAAPHLTGLIRIGSLLLFLSALNGAQTGALAGFEAFHAIAQVNLLAGVATFPLMVGGVWLWGTTGAVWALVVSMAINWILNHLALRREAARHVVPFTMAGCTREWSVLWKFSLPAVLAGSVVGPVTWGCNAILVNRPNGYAEMGVFNAANQWFGAITFLPMMTAQVMLPMLSEQVGEKNSRGTARTLGLGIVFNALVCAPLGIAVLLLSPYIMKFYGGEFVSGWITLDVVMLTALLVAFMLPVSQLINASGHMWFSASANFVWAALFIITTFYLTSRGTGAVGLASGRAIAYLVQAVWIFAYAYKVLRGATDLRTKG